MNRILRRLLATAATTTLLLPYPAVAAGTSVTGTITSVDGKYRLHVADEHGTSVGVMLHPGTVIDPSGATLRTGMRVIVAGSTQDQTVQADTINALSRGTSDAALRDWCSNVPEAGDVCWRFVTSDSN